MFMFSSWLPYWPVVVDGIVLLTIDVEFICDHSHSVSLSRSACMMEYSGLRASLHSFGIWTPTPWLDDFRSFLMELAWAQTSSRSLYRWNVTMIGLGFLDLSGWPSLCALSSSMSPPASPSRFVKNYFAKTSLLSDPCSVPCCFSGIPYRMRLSLMSRYSPSRTRSLNA